MAKVVGTCPCCLRPWTAAEADEATRGVLQLQADGTWKVAGPLALTLAPHRVRLVLATLEAAAVMRGDTKAAAVYLDFMRWRTEMRKGKAPARLEVQHSGRVTVVDDLGPASGNGGYVNRPTLPGRTIEVQALPAPQETPSGSGPGRS